ncbi:hypothetical protein [Sphingomonas faeni]|uniref:hypothetical protein n=1 Tax=Sphingomonas faeni TaxID=185950 RepID=UPI003347F065
MNALARVVVMGVLAMISAVSCSGSKADMVEGPQTDIATLRKFVTLQPTPIEAKWSVAKIGTDAVPGPSDTTIWAVVRYSEADFTAVSRALRADDAGRPITVSAPPAWLLADVNLARFRHGSDYVFEHPVSAGRPFASDLYSTGFALILPDHRVLVHFSST